MKSIYILLLLVMSVAQSRAQSKPYKAEDVFVDVEKMKGWNCPDAVKDFPPIELKQWAKTPAVSGRMATYAEYDAHKALLFIDPKVNRDLKDAKPYKTRLPRLAYCTNPETKKTDLVVVVQMLQLTDCVWVGYRFLSGGVGSCTLKDCKFLTDAEVKKMVGK